jgi:multiple antibiotic resistance protein
MVFERRDKRKAETAGRALQGQLTDSRAASLDDDDVRRLAVFPLAIPLIAGPGAISATILIASGAPGPLATAGLLAIIAGLILSCLVAFLLAGRLDRLLGETGRVVLSRLLGVLLAALSVQFVADGVVALAKNAGMVAGH